MTRGKTTRGEIFDEALPISIEIRDLLARLTSGPLIGMAVLELAKQALLHQCAHLDGFTEEWIVLEKLLQDKVSYIAVPLSPGGTS